MQIQSSEITPEKVDVVVIGSSPILMLYALRSRKAGNSVSLIEEANTMGGAWSLDTHFIGTHDIVHENACHLIEWYAGGYQLLESISGIRFLLLDPQPFKVWRNGRCALYTSRKSILIGYVKACLAIVYSTVKLGVFYLDNAKYKKEAGWFNLRNSLSRMMMELRYRLLCVTEFDGIRGPEGGFTHFVRHLSEQLEHQGVNVVRGRAGGLIVDTEGRGQISVGERIICAESIVVGESSVLDGTVQQEFMYTDYHHVLVSLGASDTICRNSYIHFPDHPIFHRITYVEDTVDEDGIEVAIFLLQLRLPLADVTDLKTTFELVQNLYPIAKSTKNFKLLKSIKSNHISSSSGSAWRSFDKSSPFVLKTIGDLSRNMLLLHYAFSDKYRINLMNDIRLFWNKQNTSLNRESGDTFYKKKASEHRSVLTDSDAHDGILDLGCGAGELLFHLQKLAQIDIGLDYSEAMVKAAQQRLVGEFSGLLLQADIFTYLPSATQPVWTTTGAINQYLDAVQLGSVLDMFVSNEKVRSFYLFDSIDPLRYDLLLQSISYRPEHITPVKFVTALKNYVRRFLTVGHLILNSYAKDTHYLGSPSMGFGQRPAFWLRNCNIRGLNVEIISSRYYEYRYHVIIKKNI